MYIEQNKTAIIVTGGAQDDDFIKKYIGRIVGKEPIASEEPIKGESLYFIASDSGLAWFLRSHLTPSLIVGDFDSLMKRLEQEETGAEPAAGSGACEEALSAKAISAEAACEEAISEEAACEEALSEEAISAEAACEEAISEEAISKEAACEEVISEEAACEEAVIEEALPKKPVIKEVVARRADSVEEILRVFKQQGCEIRRFRPEKDLTDTQIAAEAALEKGCSRIHVLGGTGSRLDHVLGNIQVMEMCLERGAVMLLADPHNRISMHQTSFEISADDTFGSYISFVPWGGPVRELTLEGFKYPLTSYTLRTDQSLAISNEISNEIRKEGSGGKVRVSFSDGRLLMIEAAD